MSDKETGSFYTPEGLINYMVKYLRNRITPKTILEPSAGDGRFVPALREFAASVSLAEFKEEKAKKLIDSFGTECMVHCGDFIKFSLDTENTYDLIIGNPPYIAKKNVPKDQCESSEAILKFFDLDSSIFQNLWVSFVLSSLKLLAPNGSIFFVLPFEFLQVQYAEKLREFLEGRFNTIEITTFEDSVFPEIEQDVCLVYLSNEQQGKSYIKYTTLVSDSNTTMTFESVIQRNKPLKKWSNCILNFDKNDTEPKAAFTARSDKASAPGGMYIEAAQYAAIDQALTDAGFGIQFTQDKSNADTASKGQAAVPAKVAEAAEVPVEAKREVPDTVEKPVISSVPAEEPVPNLTFVTTSVEMPVEQISEESADAVQLGGYTNEMSVEEICARMTLEEAENYIVPLGTCNGQTMGQVADRRPASLRYYISGYSGDNNILRAAATLVSQSRCQKAS